jgi:hypothetical protein
VPVPYMRWSGNTAIIVAANRNKEKDANLTIHIPLEHLGTAARGRFKVTDLWHDGKAKYFSAEELTIFSLKVKRDNAPRGGLSILKVEPVR